MNLYGLIGLVPGLSGAAENEIAKITSHLADESHNSGCALNIKISFEPDPNDANAFRSVGSVKADFPKLTRQGKVLLRDGSLELDTPPEGDQNQGSLPLEEGAQQ